MMTRKETMLEPRLLQEIETIFSIILLSPLFSILFSPPPLQLDSIILLLSLSLSLSKFLSMLRNSYWILRHGKSIPNEKGIIVSSMENGTLTKFGLASEGFDQARLAGELFNKKLKENNILLENVRICYSPFSRTTHTAKVVADVLGIQFESPQCKVMPELRERYFGPSFELLSHDKYSEIWNLDEKDPFMPPEGGESVADVVLRLSTALLAMESEFQGCTVLVVSHGDPLQILQTISHALKDAGPSASDNVLSSIEEVKVHSVLRQHRKFALFTAELRQII